MKDLSKSTLQTIRQSETVGMEIGQMMVKYINSPTTFEKRLYVFRDEFDLSILDGLMSFTRTHNAHSMAEDVQIESLKEVPKTKSQSTRTKTLKLLLLDDSQSVNAIKTLIPYFEKTYDVKIEISTKSYDQLFDTLNNPINSSQYDIYSVDMPWISDLVSGKRLLSLEENLSSDYMKDSAGNYTYPPSRLGLHQQTLFGIPYLIGLQMIFYRKDLFGDQNLKEMFYEKYQRDLEPPVDWYHYNQIAKFFTRRFNKQSPTVHGTCLADYFKGSILGEILPRIWAYDGMLIDDQQMPHLSTPQVKSAFENYIEATSYGTEDTPHYAEDVAKFFCQGDVAMITSYVSYAPPILYDRLFSGVNGLVDFSPPMPSDSSMVSGWSLCINRDSQHMDSASDFLKWFLSIDISYRYSLITGNPTRHQLYTNANLKKLYPWLPPLAKDTFNKGYTRNLIHDNKAFGNERDALESMIAGIIYRYQSSKSSLHSLLKQADRDLTALLKKTKVTL